MFGPARQTAGVVDKKLNSEHEKRAKRSIRNVVAWVARLGVTQRQIADRMHMSEGTISKWLNGQATPTLIKMTYLADALSMSFDDLFGKKPQDDDADAPGPGKFGDDGRGAEVLRLWCDIPPEQKDLAFTILSNFATGAGRVGPSPERKPA